MPRSSQKRTVKKRKRPSGGARAVETKRKRQDSARNRAGLDYEAQWDAGVAALGPVPSSPVAAFGWAWRAMAFAMQSALTDKGLPPESRREQAARIAPQLIKALEPARLAEKLEAYEKALGELDAVPVDSPEDGGPRPAAPIC